MEEESIFSAAAVSEEISNSEPNLESNQEEEVWNPTVSSESPKAKLERVGVKENCDGKILTIKNHYHTKPKTKNYDGTPIPPKETQSGDGKFYSGKLAIRFEEDNLVEYYPSFSYFVNDGVMKDTAKINREGEGTVTKLFKLVVKKLGRPIEEVSDQDFYDFLPGKKVKIKTETGVYMKKKWFRNDIVEFV